MAEALHKASIASVGESDHGIAPGSVETTETFVMHAELGHEQVVNVETTDLVQAFRVIATTAMTLPSEREVYTVDKPDIIVDYDVESWDASLVESCDASSWLSFFFFFFLMLSSHN